MDHTKAIMTLKQAATKSQAIQDMFLDFAMRERARGQVTVRAFYNRMKKQGFNHTSAQYADGLKVLAECGFGEIRRNKRGNIVGLFGLKTTLASLGRAVVGKKGELRNFARRNKYSPVAVSPMPQPELVRIKPTPRDEKREVLKALSGVDQLVRTILNDTSVDADTRVQAALVLMQEKRI